jgi:tetratricopeptide (TPR) repeat protein
MDSDSHHDAPAGAWWTAHLLHRSGDRTGACEFYKRAVESRHPAWSVRAAVDLAALREEMGDVGEASKLYEWAVNHGDPERSDGANIWARRAATKLEILLTRQGEQAKARAIYDRVTKGVREQQALFAINRATELQARGDVEGAATSLREAIELNDPTVSERAAVMLSILQMP